MVVPLKVMAGDEDAVLSALFVLVFETGERMQNCHLWLY